MIRLVLLALILVSPVSAQPWQRHTVDSTSRGADGVRLADVNGDRLPDIVTGWEEGGSIRMYLNPGARSVRTAWPRIVVGSVGSPEDAVAVDLDGDGRSDVVSASEGSTRSINLHLAPRAPAPYETGWTTRALPAAAGRQWMFILPMDVDGRNGIDLVVGAKGKDALIGWLEAPADPRRAEDWKLHPLLDAGWVMSLIAHDMDGDGDDDVLASDRRGAHAGVFWLENPGSAVNRQKQAWSVHEIGAAGREVMFVDLAERDGQRSIVAAVKPADVLLITQAGKTETITPDPAPIGTAKAARLADLDLDGTPDLVLSFEEAKGAKSGVVWVSLPGNEVHDVSGPEGIKYDLIALEDLDGDGDPDIITCEEAEAGKGLGVVWYENPAR